MAGGGRREARGDGFEFLLHLVDRFPLLDLGGGEATPDSKRSETMVYQAAESSIGDVGDLALTVQLDLNNTLRGAQLAGAQLGTVNGKRRSSGAGLDEEGLCWKCTC